MKFDLFAGDASRRKIKALLIGRSAADHCPAQHANPAYRVNSYSRSKLQYLAISAQAGIQTACAKKHGSLPSPG
ncbi:MAG: hypothetical protein Q4G70_09195 [Pseudomonadota bacterium]|nr:hypothetical protein [Pseudomonadota bacterium]